MAYMSDPIQAFLEGIEDCALFVLDPQGCAHQWSPSAHKLLGYTAAELRGKPISAFFRSPTSDTNSGAQELQMAAVHGRFEDMGWRVRKDGTTFWAETVLTPIRSDKEDLQGFTLFIRDLTERKKSEDLIHQKENELAEARKMEAVGRLAGGIAHDFNNFITGITGLTEEVRDSMAPEDPRRSDLDEILKAASQASLLTKDLLAYGRRQKTTPQILSPNVAIQEKFKLLQHVLGSHIQPIMELDPAVKRILIDPTQLDQLLLNLVLNARDAMPSGGKLHIRTRRAPPPKSSVTLSISDTGTGIEKSVLTQIFEPFFTTKEKGKGTGLGLASVYGIVKQNNGEISVESQPGKGTTFHIQFPEIDITSAPAAEPPAQPMETGKETILVIEDIPLVLRVATQILQKAGYHVLSASSGQDALRLARAHPSTIDLILSDIMMPGLNGPETVEKLHSEKPGSAVIYMSAYAEGHVYTRDLHGNDTYFIEKPFTPALLLHKIREVLDQRTSPTTVAPR